MLAVIKTGGKQYLVSPGQKIKIEKLDGEVGKEIIFDQVLLVEKSKQLEIGNPLVKGAKVTGKLVSQGKGKKAIVLRYRPKTRYHVKRGHRQFFSEVEIKSIEK